MFLFLLISIQRHDVEKTGSTGRKVFSSAIVSLTESRLWCDDRLLPLFTDLLKDMQVQYYHGNKQSNHAGVYFRKQVKQTLNLAPNSELTNYRIRNSELLVDTADQT